MANITAGRREEPRVLASEGPRTVPAGAEDAGGAPRRADGAEASRDSEVQAVREALRTRDHVLAAVAHDLRSPLNTIIATADLMLHLSMDEEQRTRRLEVIVRSAMRMDRLIQDLLDVSLLEGGRPGLALEAIPASDIVRDAMEMHAPRAAAKSQSLRCTEGPDLPLIRADRHRLMQAFSNLLDKAIKFTPEGGAVDVGCAVDGTAVRYTVTDTGPGVSADDLTGLFNAFWQGQHPHIEGTGLGLAIVRWVVEAHGGTVRAENRSEGGARFTLTIPALASATDE